MTRHLMKLRIGLSARNAPGRSTGGGPSPSEIDAQLMLDLGM